MLFDKLQAVFSTFYKFSFPYPPFFVKADTFTAFYLLRLTARLPASAPMIKAMTTSKTTIQDSEKSPPIAENAK